MAIDPLHNDDVAIGREVKFEVLVTVAVQDEFEGANGLVGCGWAGAVFGIWINLYWWIDLEARGDLIQLLGDNPFGLFASFGGGDEDAIAEGIGFEVVNDEVGGGENEAFLLGDVE